jgi:hypothetical protein
MCLCGHLPPESLTRPPCPALPGLAAVLSAAQGPSPDEVALVDGARQIGFEFKERSHSSVRLDMQGEEVVYEVLNVMEYSSDRCVSVCGGVEGEVGGCTGVLGRTTKKAKVRVQLDRGRHKRGPTQLQAHGHLRTCPPPGRALSCRCLVAPRLAPC